MSSSLFHTNSLKNLLKRSSTTILLFAVIQVIILPSFSLSVYFLRQLCCCKSYRHHHLAITQRKTLVSSSLISPPNICTTSISQPVRPCEGIRNNNKKYRNGARGCALEISVHRIFGYALVVCVKKVNNFSQYHRLWIKFIFGELQKHLDTEWT